jgi:hypothetical protein
VKYTKVFTVGQKDVNGNNTTTIVIVGTDKIAVTAMIVIINML